MSFAKDKAEKYQVKELIKILKYFKSSGSTTSLSYNCHFLMYDNILNCLVNIPGGINIHVNRIYITSKILLIFPSDDPMKVIFLKP